ncbi:MAG: hypothetical protein KDC26_09640 [Armatimonadetes bacterium]|nr:hypothetical protein [Armatimonadota bacterium]
MKNKTLLSALAVVAALMTSTAFATLGNDDSQTKNNGCEELYAQQAGPRGGGQQGGPGGQFGGPGGPGMMQRGGGMDIMKMKEVHEHLKLNQDQIQKLMEWHPTPPEGEFQGRGGQGGQGGQGQGRGGQFGGGQPGGQGQPGGPGGPGGEMRQAMKKQQMDFVKSVLTAQQFKRYQQLDVQAMRINAFMDPEVSQQLGITEEQKQRIQKIMEENRPNFGGPGQGGRGQGGGQGQQGGQGQPPQGQRPDPAQMQAQQEKVWNAVFNVLTADQKAKYNQMTGEKFNFPAPQRGGFGGPGGQGQPGGGRPGGGGGRQGGGGGGESVA